MLAAVGLPVAPTRVVGRVGLTRTDGRAPPAHQPRRGMRVVAMARKGGGGRSAKPASGRRDQKRAQKQRQQFIDQEDEQEKLFREAAQKAAAISLTVGRCKLDSSLTAPGVKYST